MSCCFSSSGTLQGRMRICAPLRQSGFTIDVGGSRQSGAARSRLQTRFRTMHTGGIFAWGSPVRPRCSTPVAPGRGRHPGLIEVLAIALGRNVIMPGRNIAVEDAAIGNRPEIAAVHFDIREIEALRGLPIAVEPDTGLARRDWWRRGWSFRHCGRIGAACRPLIQTSRLLGRGLEPPAIAVLPYWRPSGGDRRRGWQSEGAENL
jgi:hypothetical protein